MNRIENVEAINWFREQLPQQMWLSKGARHRLFLSAQKVKTQINRAKCIGYQNSMEDSVFLKYAISETVVGEHLLYLLTIFMLNIQQRN
jgi:hypothetical protein